ncbi:MAG: protein kinase [Phycisphaerales bacterium]|nr:protein kinase [Phycisphaerales bacterium]
MNCEQVDSRLFEFLEDLCEADESAAIRSHLDSCDACRLSLNEAKALIGDLSVARSLQEAPWASGESSTATGLAAGDQIGEFEIIDELGRGGMGVVYRARQASLNRLVALKVLNPALTQSERSIHRFLSEARAAARLHHTNIVPIYAQGSADGRFYYAMELIAGAPLDRVLREESSAYQARRGHTAAAADPEATVLLAPRPETASTDFSNSQAGTLLLSGIVRSERKTRDYRRVARLVAGVAGALQHAHDLGVVHRDIKPQNLLLGADDQLHVTDFGLARLTDVAGVTLSAEIVGTPAYMAPEQINHERGDIDGRTDIYSLGATLYEMLTFTRPFDAQSYEQLIHHVLNREPRPPRQLDSHIPVDLETICLRALDKAPARRFDSAEAMARDLRRFAEDLPIESRRIGPVERAVRWVRRNPALSSAIAAATLVVILGPLLAAVTRARANEHIENAFEALMADYHDGAAAIGNIGWIEKMAGAADRREFVEAFAQAYHDPEGALKRLEPLIRAHPQVDDYGYLKAWALTRQLTSATAIAAREVISAAEAPPDTATAAGYLLRGLAQVKINPDGAMGSFETAISMRPNFMQAMLHQARATNYVMYMRRDVSYYRAAEVSLQTVARLQPDVAYPRYLLATTHHLAASSYLGRGKPVSEEDLAAALRAYAASEASAREAQVCEPESPRGYAAEAGYWESRGQYLGESESFRRAIQSWERLDKASGADEMDQAERWGYAMRLHLRLGEWEQAERARARRYLNSDEADGPFFGALISMARGDVAAGGRVAQGAFAREPSWEGRALLYAIAGVCGVAVDPPEVSDADALPLVWTGDWQATLGEFLAGRLDEAGLLAAADRTPDEPIPYSRQRVRCVALFHAGLAALAQGQAEHARELLESAAETRDVEDYCFRARAVAWTLAAMEAPADAQ